MSLEDILRAITGLKTYPVTVVDSKKLAAAGDYAAEDVLSEHVSAGTVYKFGNMARKDGGTGTITKAIAFLSTTALTPRITLFLFSKEPTTNLNDNVGNAAPSTNDHLDCEGWIDFMALEDLGGNSAALVTPSTIGNLPLDYKCIGKALYGIAVTRDAVTGEAVAMSLDFRLFTRQD